MVLKAFAYCMLKNKTSHFRKYAKMGLKKTCDAYGSLICQKKFKTKVAWNNIQFEVVNQKISFDQILTPCCNQNRYFTFLSFWQDNVIIKQKYQMKLPTIPRLRIRKIYGLNFLFLFVTRNDKNSKTQQMVNTHNIEISDWLLTSFCEQKLYQYLVR